MRKIEQYRRLLNVEKEASLSLLKTNYRNLIKEHHPDKFNEDLDAKSVAEKKSQSIIEAYHFLVSIAPETIAASRSQYDQTLELASIEDLLYQAETLRIDFSDGNSYEYFGVPKAAYIKLLNAPSQSRFLRRHIADTYTYRSINKLVAA